MPNRMLRDWTDSEKVNSLSVNAECFFTRLIMKVDDYGCFPADPRLLKANLYPLKLNVVRESDISRWLAEAQKAGLIALYEASNKQYLMIQDFKQRLDKAKAKYPLPPSQTSLPASGNSLTTSHEPMSEVETEVEVLKEKLVKEKEQPSSHVGGEPPPPPNEIKAKGKTLEVQQQELLQRQALFRKELEVFEGFYGLEMVNSFFDHWSEPNKLRTKMAFELKTTWDLKRRLRTWNTNDQKFFKQPNQGSQASGGSSAAEEFKKHLNKDTVKK